METAPDQLEKEWKAGRFRPAYYFFGEESAAKAEALKRLKEILKPDAFNLGEFSTEAGGRIDEILSTAATPPMFSDWRLVVVKNPKLGVEARKKLAQYLADPLPSTVLVLFSDERKPDVRDALTAAAAAGGGIVVFRALDAEEASRRLREEAAKAGVSLEDDAAEALVSEAGTDWGILRGELEKLTTFARGRKLLRRDDVLELLGYRQTLSPFDLTRAIERRDKMKALGLLRRLLSEGSDPFWILHQVSGTVNKQLKAKRMSSAALGEAQIFKELRLHPYYGKDFLRQACRMRDAELRSDLKACLKTETALKSKTWLDPGMELESLTARICRS